MSSLGYSSYQMLPSAHLSNAANAHFTNSYGSIVGGTTGCGGAGGSAAALAGNGKPGYNIVQKGGKRRSNKRNNKRHSNKRNNKRHSNKQSGGTMLMELIQGGHKRHSNKRNNKRHSNKQSKRHMRGGLNAMSPSSFSGGTGATYHQFTGGQPLSFNYGLGSSTPLPLNLSGMANPPPMMDIRNNCGSNHGLVGKGLLN
jgi:hypothetical protein